MLKNRLLFFFVYINLTIHLQAQSYMQTLQADVVIFGASSAGITAAYAASKLGKKVIIIESGNFAGELSSGGTGAIDVGIRAGLTGMGKEFYRRLGKKYGRLEQWIYEPHVAEQVFKEMLEEAHINVLYASSLYTVNKHGTVIQSVVCQKQNTEGTALYLFKVTGKQFIDASYEGDLMAKAGVSYHVGRESTQKYNEDRAGVFLSEHCQFPDGVNPYRKKGDPNSGLLFGIQPVTLEPEGSGNMHIQAYNFRLCLSKDSLKKIPIYKPEGYDSTWFELLARQIEQKPIQKLGQILAITDLPNSKADINHIGGFSTDAVGLNWNYPEVDYKQRKAIINQHVLYTKGLLYFISTDKRIPEKIRFEMNQYGYAKDEYVMNGGFSPQLNVRESRRMVGEYVMTSHDCLRKTQVSDAIAYGSYSIHSNNCNRIVVDGNVKNEGYVEIPISKPYPISYKILTPHKSECTNLLVPVCVSASHLAYNSLNTEAVFMTLGQVAGIAATYAIAGKVSVQSVPVKKIQDKLLRDPYMNGNKPEIIIDNEDSIYIVKHGDWQYDTTYLHQWGYSCLKDMPSTDRELKFVRFKIPISNSGAYRAYVYWPEHRFRKNTLRVIVSHAYGQDTVALKPDSNTHIWKYNYINNWAEAGTFIFKKGGNAAITIVNTHNDDIIIADSILLIPVE